MFRSKELSPQLLQGLKHQELKFPSPEINEKRDFSREVVHEVGLL